MQSTSKTFESTRQEALAADVRKAGELVASSSGAEARPPGRRCRVRRSPREAQARGRGDARATAPASAATRPRRRCSASRSRPPPEPVALRARARAAPRHPDPVRAPARRRGATPTPQAGVEKKFAAADTLGQVMAREGFGSRRPERHRGARQAGRPAHASAAARSTSSAPGDDGTPDGVRIPAHARAPLPGRARGRRRGRARRWTARKLEATVEIKIVEAGGTVESSLYESVQKAGESTDAGQPAGRAVRLGRELLHRHRTPAITGRC